MKRNSIFFVIALFLMVGCTDAFLDVENRNHLDEGSFFQTENDLKLAVNSAYCPLAHNGFGGQGLFFKFGTLSDRIWFEDPTSFDKLIIDAGYVTDVFKDCYRGVFRCSDILGKMHRIPTTALSDEARKPYIAQLKTLRAMYYYQLVVLFRAPYFYDETNMPSEPLGFYGNATSEIFWDKINEDLTYAVDPNNGLPVDWGTSERGRVTRGAAWALWGKARLWKHYYYYLENGKTEYTSYNLNAAGEKVDFVETWKYNLEQAKKCFNEVTALGYALQGEAGTSVSSSNAAETKQDFLNALLSNSTYVRTLEGFGGKSYYGENNGESIWEIQYSDDPRENASLPGWMSSGAQNYRWFGTNASGYLNHEMDPEAYYVYEREKSEVGPVAKAAGFDIDPRAEATFFMDATPDHPVGWIDHLDWRRPELYYKSTSYSKRLVSKYALYKGDMPLGTTALMRKKYSYPEWDKSDSNFKDPNCDPFNIRMIRYADVLLMYAETCYLLGEIGGDGLKALNRVRARAGMNPLVALNEEVIIKERDFELMGEFFRFFDIIRWCRSSEWFDNINFSANFTAGYSLKENIQRFPSPDAKIPYRIMYMPYPQGEIDKNKGKLIQNPGW